MSEGGRRRKLSPLSFFPSKLPPASPPPLNTPTQSRRRHRRISPRCCAGIKFEPDAQPVSRFHLTDVLPAEKAISMGMEKKWAMWLVSTTGLTNTFGRVICGWISSYDSVDPFLVNNLSLTFGGLYTCLLPLLPCTVFSYYLYASLFGFSMGKFGHRYRFTRVPDGIQSKTDPNGAV